MDTCPALLLSLALLMVFTHHPGSMQHHCAPTWRRVHTLSYTALRGTPQRLARRGVPGEGRVSERASPWSIRVRRGVGACIGRGHLLAYNALGCSQQDAAHTLGRYNVDLF